MPRLPDDDVRPTYAAAERFIEACLRRDDSLFTPGRAIWSATNVGELMTRFVGRPDVSEGSFDAKLQAQLQGAPDAAIQLMAEAMYAYYLCPNSVAGPTKREAIASVLAWMGKERPELPPDLAASLDRGFGSAGTSFNTRKPYQLAQLLRFVNAWKRLDERERGRALDDPWFFKEVLDKTPVEHGAHYMHEALLYLTHPATFEPIFALGQKQLIVKAVGDLAPAESDLDRHLASIRQALAARYGPDIDFYRTTAVVALWNPARDPWQVLIYWAGRLASHPQFEEWEITYKLKIAEHIREAKKAIERGDPDAHDRLKQAFGSPNNLTSFYAHGQFLEWAAENQEQAASALARLWREDGDAPQRIGAFLERLPTEAVSGKGTRTTLAAYLHLAMDPQRWPPYKTTEFEKAYALTGFASKAQTEGETYAEALRFLDELIERGAEGGVTLASRLVAQGALYSVLTATRPEDWTDQEWRALEQFRIVRGIAPDDDDVLTHVPEPEVPDEYDPQPPGDPISALAEELLVNAAELRSIVDLLHAKRQVIFYGPPGTGKTYLARKLARTLAGDDRRVRLVQFHPSYSYEDFVEGYRPRVLENGQPGFELVDGPLKRIAKSAASDPEIHVLIIDEINRGNVAKVLGELYFLLEYRMEEAELLYSAKPFALPDNLRIIGTMNTADRSIALMDAALRRRFGFVPFFPDEPPIQGLLRRWLTRDRPAMLWVADILDLVNSELQDRNSAVGPSYFMGKELDDEHVARIWRHEIRPYLQEFYFEQPERMKDFELTRLRARLAGQAPDDEGPESVDESQGDADAQPV